MRLICSNNTTPGKHSIFFCPIIDLKSENMSCILTTIEFVIGQHDKYNFPGIPILTFDAPLWKKAMIVKHHYKFNIFILPGNFHKQLSSLAGIGYLMKNTGLKETLLTIYGENTVKSILNGKDYERAVRAHGLVTTALKEMLLENVPDEEKYAITAAGEYYNDLVKNEDKTSFRIPDECPILENLLNSLDNTREGLCTISKTNETYFSCT